MSIVLDLVTLAKVNRAITILLADGVNAGQANILEAMRASMGADIYWKRALGDRWDEYLAVYQAEEGTDPGKDYLDRSVPVDEVTAGIATFMYNDFMFEAGLRDFVLSDEYTFPLLGWLNEVAPLGFDTYGAVMMGEINRSDWETPNVADQNEFGTAVLTLGGETLQ